MKKKLLSALLCVAMVASLAACGGNETKESSSTPEESTSQATVEESKPVTLVYAEVNPLDTIAGKMAQDFKTKVEELSGGNITIDVQASGVLGSENDVLDAMLADNGTVQMSRISAFALTSYGGQKSKLLSLPYTFANRDHYWAFATSDLADEFLSEPAENGSGVRGLFYGEEGFRHFFAAEPINSIEDLKGKKIRVSNDPVMVGMVEGLGANATEVAFTELYSGLSSGVADVAEQPIANYKSNAFPEVAPYMILDGHTLGAIQVIITESAWESLSAEQQGWIKEAGAYASENNRANSAAAEEEVKAQLIEEGVTFVEVTDVTPWQEACKAVTEENTKGMEDLYQQILDMAN